MVIIIGNDYLFLLINRGLENVVLDFICVYLSIPLFSLSLLFSLIILYRSHTINSLLTMIISILSGPLSYGIGSLLKIIFMVPRPYEVLPARIIGLMHTSSFSFPSTTTMLIFGFAFPILFEKQKLGHMVIFFAFLIGFSVIYTGYHFPADVVAGAFFSLIIALCIDNIKPRILRFLHNKFNIK